MFCSLHFSPSLPFYGVPFIALLALGYAWCQSIWVRRQDRGSVEMEVVSSRIAQGAISFLQVEYKIIALFVLLASIVLAWRSFYHPNGTLWVVVSFMIGASFSAFSGYIGMRIATVANVSTTQAARTSLCKALDVAFTGGAVMATAVVGLALLGLSGLLLMGYVMVSPWSSSVLYRLLEVLTGFSLGAETVALFARLAGGIYTKAADVGADIVGKIEHAIPEDDPRNPATVADNVGDNVGDVAGMGADLFGSYVSTLLAAIVLGQEVYREGDPSSLGLVLLPCAIAGWGIISSIVGIAFVRLRDEEGSVQRILHVGNCVALILAALGSYLLIGQLVPASLILRDHLVTPGALFYTVLLGLGVGLMISLLTDYFTTSGYWPVDMIIHHSLAGPATNVMAGLSVGMLSTVAPVLLFAMAISTAFYLAGFYGIAMAAVGMMSTTVMQLTIDAFGPIADNAGGIAEMTGLPKEVRGRTDILDTVGNTTAATGKGFAIASAALTAMALFAAFVSTTGLDHIDIYKPQVLSGLLIGGMVPCCFSALAIQAVGKTAGKMVLEVRRQFAEIPGLIEGKATPDYDRCIKIATYAALRQMFLPTLLALGMPLLVGLFGGAEVLASFLAGVMVMGILFALFQCNAGGAWDNAKKAFEKGVVIEGSHYKKGSKPHDAAIVGDTVGDPFKDTSGPSINILIKITAIVALLLAPHLT